MDKPLVEPPVGGLPVIQRPLDNTALSAYMNCPREYYFSMHLHRRGGGGRSPALAYGSAMHLLLEHRYKGIPKELSKIMVSQWWEANGHNEEGDYRTLARAFLDYDRYCDKYGATPDAEQGTTVGWPDEPMVEISANVMGGGLIHPWAAKIDRIIELGGMHYVEDHKTTSRLDKNYYNSFELSNQMMGYTRAAQLLMPSLKIAGIRLNVIHATKTATNFERQLFTWTKEQLAEWVSNTNQWMRRLARDIEDWESLGRDEYPVGHYGDNGCSRKYGMCSYAPACRVATPFRRNVIEEYPIEPWDPMHVDD